MIMNGYSGNKIGPLPARLIALRLNPANRILKKMASLLVKHL
jgi:hypothetical protein